MLDGFYNAKVWQPVTRKLIVEQSDFLHRFLAYLTAIGVIDQPLGLERRGVILYEFCKAEYPQYETAVSLAWIEGGMSLKKQPASRVRTKHVYPVSEWETVYGEYREGMRLCLLPATEDTPVSYWFGFDTETQQTKPLFKAFSYQIKD